MTIMDIPSQVLEYYNSAIYIEDAGRCAKRKHLKEIKKIKAWLEFKRDWKTLEIGCGKGVLKEAFPNWTGLDISQKALAEIPKGYPTVLASAEKVPFKDESFDLVVMFDTIEHVQDPEQALKEAIRVLKPHGCLIIRSPQLVWSPRRLKCLKAPIVIVKELVLRITEELRCVLGQKIKFRFLRNEPNYTKIGADWDATYLFNPHNVLLYLKSNYGMTCLNQKSFPLQLGITPTYSKIMILKKG